MDSLNEKKYNELVSMCYFILKKNKNKDIDAFELANEIYLELNTLDVSIGDISLFFKKYYFKNKNIKNAVFVDKKTIDRNTIIQETSCKKCNIIFFAKKSRLRERNGMCFIDWRMCDVCLNEYHRNYVKNRRKSDLQFRQKKANESKNRYYKNIINEEGRQKYRNYRKLYVAKKKLDPEWRKAENHRLKIYKRQKRAKQKLILKGI